MKQLPSVSNIAVGLLSRQQQAAWAGVSLAQLDKLHGEGKGPRVLFLGSRRMARLADLEAWAAAQVVESANATRHRTGKRIGAVSAGRVLAAK